MIEVCLQFVRCWIVDCAVDEVDFLDKAYVIVAELACVVFIEFLYQVFYVFAFVEQVEHVGNGWSCGVQLSYF